MNQYKLHLMKNELIIMTNKRIIGNVKKVSKSLLVSLQGYGWLSHIFSS